MHGAHRGVIAGLRDTLKRGRAVLHFLMFMVPSINTRNSAMLATQNTDHGAVALKSEPGEASLRVRAWTGWLGCPGPS
ncbi:hypothetical protein C0V76_07060 [Uliginosibacterium sp. TH139]|nr:hypothetical protein C0V76_07060 [Uliginosibacterium sp. TH139]